MSMTILVCSWSRTWVYLNEASFMIGLKRISILLLLVPAVLSFAQQSPATAGHTADKEPSIAPASQAVLPSPHPASVPNQGEGRIKIDVVVTDSSGHHAPGLDLKDFTLLDNDQPVKSLSFQAIDGTVQKANPPVEVILLIDAMNVGFSNVALQRQAMETFLRQNGGHLAQPVSIFELTNDGVSAQPKPSSDGNAQAAELIKIESKLRTVRRSSYSTGGAYQLFLESIQNLASIAKAEAGKPGRKLLIWASTGWTVFDQWQFISPHARQLHFDTIVDLSTSLRQSRISLYSISSGEALPSTYYKDFLKGVRSPDKAGPGNLALMVLAEQSGGRVLGPDNDLVTQINTCVSDANSFYTISFDPQRADKKNEYHDLKVQIGKPGLTARTTTGYYNRP